MILTSFKNLKFGIEYFWLFDILLQHGLQSFVILVDSVQLAQFSLDLLLLRIQKSQVIHLTLLQLLFHLGEQYPILRCCQLHNVQLVFLRHAFLQLFQFQSQAPQSGQNHKETVFGIFLRHRLDLDVASGY